MKILVVGEELEFVELKAKVGQAIKYKLIPYLSGTEELNEYDVIFDFKISSFPDHYEFYRETEKPVVFLNTVGITLAELQFTYGKSNVEIYGFNGLPTFINRGLMEISCLSDPNTRTFEKLKTDFELVDDRVGLVTPRIVLMIINEAYYTVQEGTAIREDIDQGMKLGTNYPKGPFEWAKEIGIENVYETLEAIYEDTKEERYKIAPLLKKEYLLK